MRTERERVEERLRFWGRAREPEDERQVATRRARRRRGFPSRRRRHRGKKKKSNCLARQRRFERSKTGISRLRHPDPSLFSPFSTFDGGASSGAAAWSDCIVFIFFYPRAAFEARRFFFQPLFSRSLRCPARAISIVPPFCKREDVSIRARGKGAMESDVSKRREKARSR